MTLDGLKGIPTETTQTEAPVELVSVVPDGGFGAILSADEVTEKTIVTGGAGEPAMSTSNPLVAEAMDTLDVGLTGLAVELQQYQERGREAVENGESIDAIIDQDLFNPNLDSEIEKRQADFVPGAESSTPNITVTTNDEDDDEDDDNDFVLPTPTPVNAPIAPAPVQAKEEPTIEEPEEEEKVNTEFDIDDADFSDLDDDDDSDDDASEDEDESDEDFETRKQVYIDRVKTLLNVIPSDDVVDLSSMVISTKSLKATKAVNYTKIPTLTASHVLLTSGKLVTLTALESTEIVNFNPATIEQIREIATKRYKGKAANTVFTVSTMSYYVNLLETIYNHIVSPKPASFKEWCKTIYWADVDDLIFAAYKATYGQVGNILSYSCDDGCGETWPELKNVDEMISFESDDPKWKERYNQILKSNPDASMPPETELVQVSKEYAFKLGAPTLDKIAEIAALDMDFANKYMDLVSITQYVYDVYYIDRASNTLVPVQFKEYPDDSRKTSKSRLKSLGEIIRHSLTADQRQILVDKTDKYDRPADALRYIYPTSVCPKCGKVTTPLYADPSSLVFTRYQLVTLTNS